jgi:hypothetical protein
MTLPGRKAQACAGLFRRHPELGYLLVARFMAVVVDRLGATGLRLLDRYEGGA